MSVPGLITADTQSVLEDFSQPPYTFMGETRYPSAIVKLLPDMAQMEYMAGLSDPATHAHTKDILSRRIKELERKIDQRSQIADQAHQLASAYMVALTDSDDDDPTENLDRFEDARDQGDETVQVLKQALGHYKDIQSHVGAGKRDSLKKHRPPSRLPATQSRQRAARAEAVARRRGVTPYPVPTPLQQHEARFGIDPVARWSRERMPYVPHSSGQGPNFPSPISVLPPRAQELRHLQERVVSTNRFEQSDAHFDPMMEQLTPGNDAPTEPGEMEGPFMAPQASLADRARLRYLQRLEDLDRDETLQAFENSEIQRQLGAGIVEYD